MFEYVINKEANKIRSMLYDYEYIIKQYNRYYNAYKAYVMEGDITGSHIKNFYILKEAYRIVMEEMEGNDNGRRTNCNDESDGV